MAARTFYKLLIDSYLLIALLILIFCQNDAIEVAADKVTKHDADIDAKDLEASR